MRDVEVVNAMAYVIDLDGVLHVYNVADPDNPVEQGSLTLSDFSRAFFLGLHVAGDHAYIYGGSGAGLAVVDLSNPSNPTPCRHL